jgi:kumamolisin
MKRLPWCISTVTLLFLLAFSPVASAQVHVIIPESTMPHPRNANGDVVARTHLRILTPGNGQMNFGMSVQPNELPPVPGYLFETPASLACVYALVAVTAGCNPNVTTTNAAGGARVITIVDAYDDPTAVSDLATFSSQFGLPAATFSVVFATGTRPAEDPTGGWEIEESLDIEWAHAMAPSAKIYLVEAASPAFSDLFTAVVKANSLISAGGEMSMSWGAAEFSTEKSYDTHFTKTGVVYVVSTGDSPGVEYPAASTDVVSAGGTTVSRSTTTGDFISETSWQDGGSGPSAIEPRPAYQNPAAISSIVGTHRGTPDLSFDANPNTGVWIYDTNPIMGVGWYVVGGTSVAAPSLTGIINAAGSFKASSILENDLIYGNYTNPADYRDITYGNCGVYIGTFAAAGYDLCTGTGTVQGLHGK